MIDSSARRLIERARARIRKLKEEPAYGIGWRTWYNDTCALLSSLYGVDSIELNGFLQIRFEIEKATLGAEEMMRQALPMATRDEPFVFSQEHYFRERLSEADEYLLALIVPIG